MVQDFVNFLNELRSSNSINHKKQVLCNYCKNETVRKLLFYAYNPYLSYYMTEFKPEITQQLSPVSPFNLLAFITVLEKANKREYTPARTREALTQLLQGHSQETVDAVSCIVVRDIRAGVNIKTINSQMEDLIPHFEVMLAEKIENEDFSGLSFPITISPKLDGYRSMGMERYGEYDLLSREGRVLDSYTSYFRNKFGQIAKHLDYGTEVSCIFDGEVMSPKGYSETSKARAKGSDKLLHYHIFDFLLHKEDVSPYNVRISNMRKVEEVINELGLSDHFRMVYPTVVHNETELKEAHYRNLELGYEGSMIKPIGHVYEWRRTQSWIKYKPFITQDLEIIEILEGTNKLKNNFGSFVLSGKDENNNIIKCNCGSGFSDKQRKHIWDNKSYYLNKIAQIKAQEITEDQDGYFSLRFPVFDKIRMDKTY